MDIQVLVEPVANNGYRARVGAPLGLSADGATREEAVAKLREQVAERLRNGSQLLTMQVPNTPEANPWVEFAAMFKDDPWIDDWKKSVEEYRREKDAKSDAPGAGAHSGTSHIKSSL